jgi:hypothetical protein
VIVKGMPMANLPPPLSDHHPKPAPAPAPSPQPATHVVGLAQTPSRSPSEVAERTRRIVSIMSHRGQGAAIEDTSPDPAVVIAAAIRFATRRGRSLSALPASIRMQLHRLCDAGDPAALVVRDWIECKLPDAIADALAETDDDATNGRA